LVGIEHAIRPKQNETIEGRIAKMAAQAPAENPDSNGLLSVAQLVERFDAEDRWLVWEWVDDINQWAARPQIEVLQTRADSQRQRLLRSGFDVVIDNGRIIGAKAIS
jgi:hypothetical protein